MSVKRLVGCAWILACLLAGGVKADEAKKHTPEPESDNWLTGAVELSILSGHLWHGMLINDEPVMQPSLTLDALGFSFNIWANYDFTDAYSEEAPAFTRVEYTLAYSASLINFDWSVGISEYTYPNTYTELAAEDGAVYRESPDPTHMVYGYLARSDLPVVPSLTIEYSYGRNANLYAVFGLAYERELANQIVVELTASLAWANGDFHALYYDVQHDALSDATTGVSLIWSPNKRLSLTASLLYSYLVNETVSDAAKASGYDAPDALVGRLTANWTF